MKRINQRDFTEGYHDPYSTFRRSMNMNDDRLKTSGHLKIRNIPIWGDGERMTKLTTLIEYMEASKMETIDLDGAASVMTSKKDYAYNLLNRCGRFERVGRGAYKLLPKKAKEGEGEAQPAPQPDAQPQVPIQAPKAHEVPYMTKAGRIIAFMERKGWTEISVASAANLIGLTINGTYPHLSQSKRFELCGRGKYRLLPDPDAPAPAPEPEPEPAQDEGSAFRPAIEPIDLDERMARYKQDQTEPVTPEEQPAVQPPVQQEEIQVDEQKERMSIKEIIADSVLITKLQEEIAGLREVNNRLNAKLADKRITDEYSNTPQTAQTAQEPRKVIRLCLCPHCGKQIITE